MAAVRGVAAPRLSAVSVQHGAGLGIVGELDWFRSPPPQPMPTPVLSIRCPRLKGWTKEVA